MARSSIVSVLGFIVSFVWARAIYWFVNQSCEPFLKLPAHPLFTDTAPIFKEYYGMPRGHERDPIYSLSIFALFGPIRLYVFLEKDCNRKNSLCRVWM